MNDIVGSIWEDDERTIGTGRYFLVLTAEPYLNDPDILVTRVRDLDHETEKTQRIEYDTRWRSFTWLENLRRIA